MGQVVCFFEVIIGTSSDFIEEVKLCTSASKDETNPIQKFLLGLQLIFIDKVLSKAQSSFWTRNNGYFQQRVSALQKPRNNSMPALMVSNCLLLFDWHKAFPFHSSNDSLRRQLKVQHLNDIFTASCCQNRSLIAEIGQFSTTETRTECCYSLRVLLFGVFRGEFHRSQMD